jgi:DNA-binding response OmpR family regulator
MSEQPIKLLIAEDEADVLRIMAKDLAQQGYAVVTAQDGEEAWRKIQSEKPDIVLLDLIMPKLTGFDVLSRLRKNPTTEKWQPVIIVSAKSELDDMQKGFAMEADHYLTKPCKMEDVLRAIKLMRSLIPQHKSREEIDHDSESR